MLATAVIAIQQPNHAKHNPKPMASHATMDCIAASMTPALLVHVQAHPELVHKAKPQDAPSTHAAKPSTSATQRPKAMA